MTKQKSFFTELLADWHYALALMVIFTTAVGFIVWATGEMAILMLSHKDFLIRMTAEILRNESIWEPAAFILAGIGGFIGFAIVIGMLLKKTAANYPEVKPEYEAGEE